MSAEQASRDRGSFRGQRAARLGFDMNLTGLSFDETAALGSSRVEGSLILTRQLSRRPSLSQCRGDILRD